MAERRMSTSGESLYQLLGVEKGASPEEIKRAYRRMALRHHPDKNQGNPDSEEKFKEVNNANAVLTNENKKLIYDQYGSVGLSLAEQIGEENIPMYLCLNGKCFKACAVLTCLLTGCCFCCCCGCCCCCFCCCGLCAPKPSAEHEWGDIRPEDLEDEIIMTQPQTDYQAIKDTQADVVSIELDTPPVTTTSTAASEKPPPSDKAPIEDDKAPTEGDKQTIADDGAAPSTPGEETPPFEDPSRNLIPAGEKEEATV